MTLRKHFLRLSVGLLLLAPACGGGGGGSSPTTPPPPPPVQGEVWGAVGCSMTMFSVQGYAKAGGQAGWPAAAISSYPSGDISEWADLNDPRWQDFQAALDEFGAEKIWFQPCVRNRSNPNPTGVDLDQVEVIAREIQDRAPGLPIFVSALPQYVGDFCGKVGPAGSDVSQALADHLVQMGMAEPGPIVGPLNVSQTKENMCGLNESGELFVGGQLMDFFG